MYVYMYIHYTISHYIMLYLIILHYIKLYYIVLLHYLRYGIRQSEESEARNHSLTMHVVDTPSFLTTHGE